MNIQRIHHFWCLVSLCNVYNDSKDTIQNIYRIFLEELVSYDYVKLCHRRLKRLVESLFLSNYLFEQILLDIEQNIKIWNAYI